jgi:hypothetical protein
MGYRKQQPPRLLSGANEEQVLSAAAGECLRRSVIAELPSGEAHPVAFTEESLRHACTSKSLSGGQRLYDSLRGERALWIPYTLEHPTCVLPAGSTRLKFLCRMADRRTPWYMVIVDRDGEGLQFRTAYGLSHAQYQREVRAASGSPGQHQWSA